jgi:hypothetical protein
LFFRKGLTLLPVLASNLDPPTSASQVAGIRGVYHHAWLLMDFNKLSTPGISIQIKKEQVSQESSSALMHLLVS